MTLGNPLARYPMALTPKSTFSQQEEQRKERRRKAVTVTYTLPHWHDCGDLPADWGPTVGRQLCLEINEEEARCVVCCKVMTRDLAAAKNTSD